MADSSTLSMRLDADIIDRLDDAAAENNTSRSHLAREALLIGVQELAAEDGGLDVPDHLAHDAKVRQMLARNKKQRRRGKFRSEFSKQLKSSFKRGETPAEFRDSVAGYIEEAEQIGRLPEGVREQVAADVETFSGWVDHMLEYYSVAYDAQNFDHDPVDDPLGNHEGVENAKDWITRAENIATAESDGSAGKRERRRRIAGAARRDGVLPQHLQEESSDADRTTEGPDGLDVIVQQALDLQQSQEMLTDTEDTPEIE